MKYAQEGNKFFRVITPSVAIEHELPIDADDMTKKQAELYSTLEATAEQHGTSIQCGNYAVL